MSYTQAITELRQLLADTEFNKKATKKRLIGKCDGDNKSFITYDKRILEDTFECFVDNQLVSATVVDAVRGDILLASAPDVNSKVEASYYWTFWIDEELKNFLNKGAESTGVFSSDIPDNSYLSIQAGLKQSALLFAAHLSTNALISFLINRRHSEEFLIQQDGNDDSNFSQMINALRGQAKDYWDRACFHRDDFYKRLGKRNAPAFGVKYGRTSRYGANR